MLKVKKHFILLLPAIKSTKPDFVSLSQSNGVWRFTLAFNRKCALEVWEFKDITFVWDFPSLSLQQRTLLRSLLRIWCALFTFVYATLVRGSTCREPFKRYSKPAGKKCWKCISTRLFRATCAWLTGELYNLLRAYSLFKTEISLIMFSDKYSIIYLYQNVLSYLEFFNFHLMINLILNEQNSH